MIGPTTTTIVQHLHKKHEHKLLNIRSEFNSVFNNIANYGIYNKVGNGRVG